MSTSFGLGIIVFFLNVGNFDGFHVETEILTDIEVKPCFYKDTLEPLHSEDSLGSLFEWTDRQFCVTGKTNKRKEDYVKLGKRENVVSFGPDVRFNWTKLECVDCPMTFCPIKFFGYRESYRLSPDFGYYKECNSQLSNYRHEIVALMERAVMDDDSFSFPFHHECPIKELPLKYENFLACNLKPDRWYLLEYSSLNNIEMRNKSTLSFPYQSYWVFSTHDFFLCNSSYEKFFVLKTKPLSCGLKVLLYMKGNLPFDVNVEMQMSFTADDQKIKRHNLINLNSENMWEEIIYHFSTNFSSYSVDVCFKGSAFVKTKSRNITALLTNGNQRFCVHNRISCISPSGTGAKTNINWPNEKLVVFFAVVIMFNALFMYRQY